MTDYRRCNRTDTMNDMKEGAGMQHPFSAYLSMQETCQ
jgi:hypothetical protein